jgi:hypothetical protein
MWPFRSKEPAPELEERLRKTERALELLESDLEDWKERFRRLQGRLAKRGELSDPDTVPAAPGATTDDLAARRAALNDWIKAGHRGALGAIPR